MASVTADFNLNDSKKSIFGALLEARSKYGGKKQVIHDADDTKLSYNDLVRASFALGHA